LTERIKSKKRQPRKSIEQLEESVNKSQLPADCASNLIDKWMRSAYQEEKPVLFKMQSSMNSIYDSHDPHKKA
jgi:hypothetical protein